MEYDTHYRRKNHLKPRNMGFHMVIGQDFLCASLILGLDKRDQLRVKGTV